ncbi:MAG: hypothetical protein KGI04_02280 [Candidatus Micrarchaeota archaeon]|nr:hypothetical protein [Candidatus Micrarchaeota archaeon]
MKVYKTRNSKYIVYLPDDVIRQFGLKEDDEVQFLKYNDSSFLFARKASAAGSFKPLNLTLGEINVLKRLDTLRYADRTVANVSKLLNEQEKKTLQSLIDKKAVYLSKAKGSYGIVAAVYDKFLMRKKPGAAPLPPKKVMIEQPPRPVPPPPKIEKNENVLRLEKDGYIVLPTETEASSLSLALEDSIRTGKVLGIRAFNKKFYIVLRAFFDKNSGKVLKELREGPKKVDELVKSTGLDEDGIRAMLYLLSEQGDVSERRKDVFTLI